LRELAPTVEKFPKRHKFAVDDRNYGVALDALESLIGASDTWDRRQHLRRANPEKKQAGMRPVSRPSVCRRHQIIAVLYYGLIMKGRSFPGAVLAYLMKENSLFRRKIPCFQNNRELCGRDWKSCMIRPIKG
jgi:hypothetical protein